MDFKGKTHFEIIVKTNAPKTELFIGDIYRMNVKAQPIEGKANIEIIKFFKKKYKIDVEIVSGATSKKKLLKIKV